MFMKDILDFIARLCVATIFLYEAYDSVAFGKSTKIKMTEYGLTWQQDYLFVLAVIVLVVGALFLLIGYRSKFAAVLLLIYWVPVTFIVHSFWNDDESIRRVQSILFMQNIAIAGALLMVFVHGSGKYSVRRLLDNRRIKA